MARTATFESLNISSLPAKRDFALRLGTQQFRPKQVCISRGRRRRQINPATRIVWIFVKNDPHQTECGCLRYEGRDGISADSFRAARDRVDSQFGCGPGAVETLDEVKQGICSNRSITVDLCVKVPKIDDPLRHGFARA